MDRFVASLIAACALIGASLSNPPAPSHTPAKVAAASPREVAPAISSASPSQDERDEDAIAVASQKHGLLPLSQYAAFALASMSYHDYEGLAVDEGECERLQADLGDANFMLLPNHGALTVGQTIGDAFMHMYDLIRACQIQLKMQQSGAELIYLPEHIVPNIKAQANIVHTGQTGGQKAWPAMLRRVKTAFPGFDQ